LQIAGDDVVSAFTEFADKAGAHCTQTACDENSHRFEKFRVQPLGCISRNRKLKLEL
jgi:hypothetical protein